MTAPPVTAPPVTAPLPAEARLHAPYPLLAASLAVFRDGRVLLAQRAAMPLAGRWSLPGGLVERGESLADAARREMREEVGVEAEVVGFNRHVELVQRDEAGAVRHHYVIASFVGRWLAGEGTPGPEAADVRWFDPAELGDLPVTDHLGLLLGDAVALLAGGARR